MEWIVSLSGDDFDLEQLSESFEIPELTIEKDNDSYILKSSRFLPLNSADEVKKVADELLIAINAASILELDSRNPIKINVVVGSDGGDVKTKAIFLKCEFSVRSSLKARITTTSESDSSGSDAINPMNALYQLGQSNPQVAQVRQYIYQDFNSLDNLYKIGEVIETDGFPPIQRKGKDRKEFERFKHTANCFSVSGFSARHSKDTIPPPKNSMSITESKYFIKRIIHEWLETKRNRIT